MDTRRGESSILAAGEAGRGFDMTLVRFSVSHAAEDGRLAQAAKDGDKTAFAALYDRYARMIHGLLLARVPRTDVDDLVQDVFLAAWNRLGRLREPSAFGGWLAAIARNRAIDFHRQSGEAPLELPPDLAARDSTDQHADAVQLLAMVRSLPEAYRETLVLRLVEGMTGPEIAARTGLTAASVRVNLHRGMKMLREKLGQ
jgi:RNA polymerase sigma-70 factor (ECF subfamily)